MRSERNTPIDLQRERFCQAVRQYGPAMFRTARAAAVSDADAEDAVGEAVLRAWQNYGALRDQNALRAWLLKITVNCAREQGRKQAGVDYTDDMEQLGGGTEPGGAALELWDAVLRLPEDHRVAVTLFYYEDMTLAEIAKLLGIAQGTVKSRLSRARSELRKQLREEEAIV